jgi:hypothetical protein
MDFIALVLALVAASLVDPSSAFVVVHPVATSVKAAGIKGSYSDDDMVKLESSIRRIGLVLEKITEEENEPVSLQSSYKAKEKVEPKPSSIKHVPTKEMTGVDPLYTQLCATISADMYTIKTSSDNFALSTDGYDFDEMGLSEPPKVLLVSNKGIYLETNPPYVICAAGSKMIIAWRGSETIMDWDRNFGFFPSSSSRWKNIAKVVKAQGSILSMVEDCFAENEDFILEEIKKRGITELILTGHSLAGGAAQVAKLYLEASMDSTLSNDTNPWRELNGKLTVRSISFEGPMSTVFVKSQDEDLNSKGVEFLKHCSTNMCTTSFSMDPVPHMYGDYQFGFDLINDLEKETVSQYLLTRELVKILLKKINTYGFDIIKSLVPIVEKYQHLGKIICYENADSVPLVYIDDPMDLFVIDGVMPPPQYRDIKYTPVKKYVANTLVYNHMFPVYGPGFTKKFNPSGL